MFRILTKQELMLVLAGSYAFVLNGVFLYLDRDNMDNDYFLLYNEEDNVGKEFLFEGAETDDKKKMVFVEKDTLKKETLIIYSCY